jgi:hypothetical protein
MRVRSVALGMVPAACGVPALHVHSHAAFVSVRPRYEQQPRTGCRLVPAALNKQLSTCFIAVPRVLVVKHSPVL